MRNIPFVFVDEETIDQINRADREHQETVNAFTNLAETQKSMRGMITWSPDCLIPVLKTAARRMVAGLEKMMDMSGPNSIANLERALRGEDEARRRR